MMSLLAKHAYIKVEKHVSGLRMERIREERTLYLYRDKIVTKHREIAMDDVRDLSFRKMYGSGGLLYVHATQGMFTYPMTERPDDLLAAYRTYIKNGPSP